MPSFREISFNLAGLDESIATGDIAVVDLPLLLVPYQEDV